LKKFEQNFVLKSRFAAFLLPTPFLKNQNFLGNARMRVSRQSFWVWAKPTVLNLRLCGVVYGIN